MESMLMDTKSVESMRFAILCLTCILMRNYIRDKYDKRYNRIKYDARLAVMRLTHKGWTDEAALAAIARMWFPRVMGWIDRQMDAAEYKDESMGDFRATYVLVREYISAKYYKHFDRAKYDARLVAIRQIHKGWREEINLEILAGMWFPWVLDWYYGRVYGDAYKKHAGG
jgi:hypothetical protein